MRSKSNINKIKTLCDQLNDRDKQLKINAKTLWLILEKVESASKKINDISAKDVGFKRELDEISMSLDEAKSIINDRGCKKVLDHE